MCVRGIVNLWRLSITRLVIVQLFFIRLGKMFRTNLIKSRECLLKGLIINKTIIQIQNYISNPYKYSPENSFICDEMFLIIYKFKFFTHTHG